MTTTTRQSKKARDLRANEHLVITSTRGERVEEVRHVEPFTYAGDGASGVLVVTEGAELHRFGADYKVELATADEVRGAARAKQRAEMVAGIRRFADLIEKHELPVPQHTMRLSGRLQFPEDLRELADGFGIEVVQSNYNMSADWTWPPSTDKYVLPPVEASFTAPVPITTETSAGAGHPLADGAPAAVGAADAGAPARAQEPRDSEGPGQTTTTTTTAGGE